MHFEPWWVGRCSLEQGFRVWIGTQDESALKRGVHRPDWGSCPAISALPCFFR